MFLVLCGVLQGCPLSGILFAWAMDPFLEAMRVPIDCRGLAVTRACADDVGATILRIQALAEYFRIFAAA